MATVRKNFAITGKSIVLKPKYSPQLATRKIYNSKYFRDEQYRHEIANHYRDFKQRPRIRRRRRRNVLVRYRKPIAAVPFGADPFEYRDQLPISVHYFPRFAQVYTPPRGRQCECEKRPPDETYNDTVRRIRTAASCEELKALVQQQSSYIAQKESSWRQYNWRRKRIETYTKPKWVKQEDNEQEQEEEQEDSGNQDHHDENVCEKSKQKAQQAQPPRQRRQKRRRSLGNLEFVTTAQRKQITQFTATKAADSSNKPRERYLQLASEYYEHGLLANIKYLESIPERNAIIRARGDYIRANSSSKTNETAVDYDYNDDDDDGNNGTASQRAKQSTSISACENIWNHSRIESAKSNASHSSTNTDETTPRTCEINEKIANILKLIGQQRSFNLNSGNSSNSNETKFIKKPDNWAIRVNITPVQGEFETRSQAEAENSKEISVVCGSMHDLNANAEQTTHFFERNTNVHNNNNRNNTTANVEWSPKHLHDLIDNLTHLDLNATSALEQQGLVPRITLTDYCTVNDLSKSNFYAEQQQLQQQQQTEAVFTLKSASSACSSAIVLKPTKFANKTNLDIPSDINFQDEARPP